jgi:hypothetical protein
MGYAFIIEPKTYNVFENETEQMDKCKQWGLLSEKASKIKDYYYKGNGMNIACSIIGYVDELTAVIEFNNKQQHCIHPSYLKEMQASSFSQRLTSTAEVADQSDIEQPTIEQPTIEQPLKEKGNLEINDKPVINKNPAKPSKTSKIELPVEKVKMSAIVKEFTTVPNHFSDEEDEVIIYEAVTIIEPEMEIGLAWSSHSATIKKVELEVGDIITFEAKITKKKLTKHPVPYKINNPSKIQKRK